MLEPVAEADRAPARPPPARRRSAAPHPAVDQRQRRRCPARWCGRAAGRTGRRSRWCALRSSASSASDSVATSRPPTRSVPVGRPVEAAEQVHQRRLAGAGRADDGDVLAGVDAQAHPAQRLDRDPVELVAARDVDGLDGRDDVGHGTCCPSRTRSAPRTTTRSPDLRAPRRTCDPRLALRAEPHHAFRAAAVLDDPHRVASPVAEHRGGRHRDGVVGGAHLQVDDGAHARPRRRRGRAVGRRAAAQGQPDDVGHPAAARAGRRRVDAGDLGVVASRPGTASSSAAAGTPGSTSSTSVSSTCAVRDRVEVSVTVRSGWPEATGRPSASTASTDGEPEPAPPSRSPAWPCRLSGSWSSSAGRVAGARSRRRRRQRDGAGDRRADRECGHAAAGDVDGGAGLHPLGGRQRGHRVGEAAEPGGELADRLVGAGPGGFVLRLRDPQRGQRLGPGRAGRDVLCGAPGPGEGPLGVGVGAPGGTEVDGHRARRTGAGCSRVGPLRLPQPTPGRPATRPAAAPGRRAPAGPPGPGGGRRCRRPAR